MMFSTRPLSGHLGGWRRGLLAGLLALAVSLTPAPAVAQEVDAPTNDAVEWLRSQLVRGNHLEGEFGGESTILYGPTADVALALIASRRREPALAEVVHFLSRPQHVDAYVHGEPYESDPDASPAPPVDDPTYVGANAKLGLVVTLAGRDPQDVGGDDLVENMRSLEQPNGAFHDRGRDGNFANVFGQSFAVLFLHAATAQGPTDASIDYLRSAQCANGGFPEQFGQSPCTASVDATGLALQALEEAAGGDDAAQQAAARAAAWLGSVRASNGSWSSGGSENINSTGYAGMGLLAAGTDITESREYLRMVQNADGGLPVTPGGPSDAFATAQALPLLAGANFVDPTVGRIANDTRITTTTEISGANFARGTADAVVLTRSDLFADALAGTPLAVAVNGPLLITDPTGLEDPVLAEIQRVLPAGGEVLVLGGPDALPSSVDARLEAAGYEPRRIQGPTRFETSVRIAGELGDPELQLLTTGLKFPDALAAGTVAGARGGAVLLTEGETANTAVAAYLDQNPGTRVAVGGPAAAAHPDAEPVFGADRTETAVRVATRFFDQPASVGIARSDVFADALAGGVHQARRDGPLLLTDSTTLSSSTEALLCQLRAELRQATVFGGPVAVSEPVVETIGQRILGSGC